MVYANRDEKKSLTKSPLQFLYHRYESSTSLQRIQQSKHQVINVSRGGGGVPQFIKELGSDANGRILVAEVASQRINYSVVRVGNRS